MKVTIIGGGFTGLTAAYRLSKNGHSVSLLEKESFLGGLAQGFKQKRWDWHLEAAYHHLFTNDQDILTLIQEIGLASKLIIQRPLTATLWENTMYQLDSASSLLQFPALPLIDRVRTGIFIGAMKINPFWKPLESVTAKTLALTLGGQAGWNIIWEPLMVGKFGDYADQIAASWLWARIKKRTPSLVYIETGFQLLVERLKEKIIEQGGSIITQATVHSIEEHSTKSANTKNFITRYNKNKKIISDRVLITIPTPLAKKLSPMIPSYYFEKSLTIPHLHAQVLIIESKQPILNDIYWLNITDRSFPFLAVVAHTNFMNKKHYGNNHVTYIGNYLPPNHPYLTYSKEKLWNTYIPYIKKINPSLKFTFDLVQSYLFTAPYAQPVHQVHYSDKAPAMHSPIKGVYLANMDSIVPWDRGTNYAVQLGNKAAEVIQEDF